MSWHKHRIISDNKKQNKTRRNADIYSLVSV